LVVKRVPHYVLTSNDFTIVILRESANLSSI